MKTRTRTKSLRVFALEIKGNRHKGLLGLGDIIAKWKPILIPGQTRRHTSKEASSLRSHWQSILSLLYPSSGVRIVVGCLLIKQLLGLIVKRIHWVFTWFYIDKDHIPDWPAINKRHSPTPIHTSQGVMARIDRRDRLVTISKGLLETKGLDNDSCPVRSVLSW